MNSILIQTHCLFTPAPVTKPSITNHPQGCLALVDGMITLQNTNYFTYTCHCGKKYIKKQNINHEQT